MACSVRRAMGMNQNRPVRITQRPEHIVPVTLFLAQHDAAGGVTGKCIDTLTWNLEHGLGDPSKWADPDAVPSQGRK